MLVHNQLGMKHTMLMLTVVEKQTKIMQQKLGLIFIALAILWLFARYTGKRAERLKRLSLQEWDQLRELLEVFEISEKSKLTDLKISFNCLKTLKAQNFCQKSNCSKLDVQIH